MSEKEFTLSTVSKGVWYDIHIWPATSISKEERIAYCYYIRNKERSFICDKCKNHLIINVKEDPPELYVDSAESLFYWSVRLHNKATRSYNKDKPLNEQKPEFTYPAAYALWWPQPKQDDQIKSNEECENCEVKNDILLPQKETINADFFQRVVSDSNGNLTTVDMNFAKKSKPIITPYKQKYNYRRQ